MPKFEKLEEEDMESSQGGGRSWDNVAIHSFLDNVYEQESEEEGDTIVIGVPIDGIAEDFYDGDLGDLQALEYTNPNVNRTIRRNLTDAGFQEQSVREDRKWAVANETRNDGTVIFKVELTPIK